MELYPECWDGPREVTQQEPIRIIAVRCPRCSLEFVPHPDRCPRCLEADLERVELTRGTVYASTTVHIAPPGFAAPMTVGYVDFPSGARVFGHFDLKAEKPPKPGTPVRVTAGPIGQGHDGAATVCFRFAVMEADGQEVA